MKAPVHKIQSCFDNLCRSVCEPQLSYVEKIIMCTLLIFLRLEWNLLLENSSLFRKLLPCWDGENGENFSEFTRHFLCQIYTVTIITTIA
jgi:hypothetical protein